MAKTSGGVRESRPSYKIKKPRKTASQKIADVIADIDRDGFSRASPFAIGRVEKRMKEFAEREGITLASDSIYMRPHDIAHALRDDKKAKGISVSSDELKEFPRKKSRMDLYFDKDDGKFVYTNGVAKFIISPNYQIKLNRNKIRVINFITATRISDDSEFNLVKYQKI